jgi:hypothetical protein
VAAFELFQQQKVSRKSINDIDTVIGCFSLLFYEKFQGNLNHLRFDEKDFMRSNWIILTNLMVLS